MKPQVKVQIRVGACLSETPFPTLQAGSRRFESDWLHT